LIDLKGSRHSDDISGNDLNGKYGNPCHCSIPSDNSSRLAIIVPARKSLADAYRRMASGLKLSEYLVPLRMGIRAIFEL